MICWSSTDQNQSNFAQIAKWWTGLEGQKVEWTQIMGTTTSLSTGETRVVTQTTSGDSFDSNGPVFTIQNPTLQGADLSFEGFEGPHKLQVQQLELDVQNQQLKITCSDGRAHFFSPRTETGGFRIESISL